MIRVTKAIACVAGVVLCLAQPAFSSDADVDQQLSEMREMVKGLQDKVEAQEEQLNHQGELLDDAQSVIREEEGGGFRSNIASFFEKVEVDSWVSASYFWNFNKPSGRAPLGSEPAPVIAPTVTGNYSGGANGNLSVTGTEYPFHPDHNQFMLDQIWFGIGKPATEDSRAGARFDMLFGQTAQGMRATSGSTGSGGTRGGGGDVASDLYVHQAYIEYLAPIADGLEMKIGKFATIIGAEVLQTTQNFNITTGSVYNLMQPFDHVGFLAVQNIAGAHIGVGVVNDWAPGTPDFNKTKVLAATAGYGMDNWSVSGNFLYGDDGGNANARTGLFDVVVTFDPIDALSLWANVDYKWIQGTATSGWGVALAGRYAITDALGIAGRGEYLKDHGGLFGMVGPDSEVASLTATVDYTIVEGLMVRGEVRWDWVAATSTRGNNLDFQFLKGNASTANTQTTIGADVVYTF